MNVLGGRLRVDWFGWDGRRSLPTRGPRWFISRGANFLYVACGGFVSITVPWFWVHAAIEARGWDAGWRAGFESGCSYATRELTQPGAASPEREP